jgi:small subunit ribosomal protein S20
MPIIKSAQKRAKQTIVKRKRNEKTKRSLRDEVKLLEKAIDSGKKAEATKQLSKVYSAIDTSVKKNLIHKNKAARRKSQFNNKVRNITTSKTVKTTEPKAKK